MSFPDALVRFVPKVNERKKCTNQFVISEMFLN